RKRARLPWRRRRLIERRGPGRKRLQGGPDARGVEGDLEAAVVLATHPPLRLWFSGDARLERGAGWAKLVDAQHLERLVDRALERGIGGKVLPDPPHDLKGVIE